MGACFGCQCRDDNEKPLADINKKRGCTDLPWLLLYTAWWAATWFIIGLALDAGGDPQKLIYKSDYKGDRCFLSSSEADSSVAMWLDVSYPNLFMCIDSCENVKNPLYMGDSTQFIRQCIPPLEILQSSALFGSSSESMSAAMADVLSSVEIIGAGAASALVLAFLYTWFLSGFAACLVWTAIVATIAGTGFVAWSFFQTSQDLAASGANPEQQQAAEIAAYVLMGLTATFMLIVIFLRKRIKIAVQVVKEASAAIRDIKSAVFFPLLPLALGLGYFAFWIWGALLIFSVETSTEVIIDESDRTGLQILYTFQTSNLTDIGDVVNAVENAPAFETYNEYTFDATMQEPFAVFFFHLLWNVQFMVYLTFTVISGAIAEWYFSARGENGKKIVGNGEGELSQSPVLGSFYRIVRYHLGTVLFGSFIIAAVQFVRACVKYIEQQTKSKANQVQKAIFCAIQCCLKILECCLDKLSKNAFIWNAIYGDAFCHSAFKSFSLLWRNLARVAAVNLVANYLMFIGKVVVSVLSAGLVGLILTNVEPYKTDVSSPVFPVLIVLLLAYMVASLFMVVYDTTIDTIFLCFLVDEEVNGAGKMRASKTLQQLIGKYAKESALVANEQQGGDMPIQGGPSVDRGEKTV